MKAFIQHHQIYLTPLSPIHIGCGEDFEPTNYVIKDNVLYHFQPSQLNLSEAQRQELINHSHRTDLLAIQRFFDKNAEQAVNSAHYFANVSAEIAQNWKNKVGKVAQQEKNGNQVIANLAIERTAYIPYRAEPYIPGSSFKGALATSLLNYEHQKLGYPKVDKKEHQSLVKKYLGEFADSQLRNVKFADFMPIESAQTNVFYSVNFKKVVTEQGGRGKGIALRRECILPSQYRAFKSELALLEDEKRLTIKQYFERLNQYYRPIFEKECDLLVERDLTKKEWVNAIKTLLNNSEVALVRLGKSGADSKVYQGNIAQISIMKAGVKPSATTLWLASHRENANSELLPFGWALLEVDPKAENLALKNWCDAQFSQATVFDKINALRNTEARKAEMQAQKAAAEQAAREKAEAEKAAEAAKAAQFNSATENQRVVIQFVESVQATQERQIDTSGSALLKAAFDLMAAAIQWDAADQAYLKQAITLDLLKSKIDFKKKDTEKNIKKALNKLNTEI